VLAIIDTLLIRPASGRRSKASDRPIRSWSPSPRLNRTMRGILDVRRWDGLAPSPALDPPMIPTPSRSTSSTTSEAGSGVSESEAARDPDV